MAAAEVCRRELDRTEREIQRNTTIIADYKQITAQLSSRLEAAEASAKEFVEAIVEQTKECAQCSQKIEDVRSGKNALNGVNGNSLESPTGSNHENQQAKSVDERCRELELELAQTK